MYLEVLKEEERYDCCFRRLNDSKKGTTDTSSGYKLTNKVRLVHIKVKIQQERSI